jgi:hypothetical protein
MNSRSAANPAAAGDTAESAPKPRRITLAASGTGGVAGRELARTVVLFWGQESAFSIVMMPKTP